MDVPGANDEKWLDVVSGKSRYKIKFLATKILLGRLTQSVKDDPSPENIVYNARQLHTMFAKNAHIASVQDDLKTIFG